MSNRGSWQKRQERRNRDREWCEVRLTLLRLAYGYSADRVKHLREQCPTKGMLVAYLRSYPPTAHLAKDKLYVVEQQTQEAQ